MAAASPARALFEDSSYSPRAAALGGAFAAVYDDPASLLLNPAAAAEARDPAFGAGYLREFNAPAGPINRSIGSAEALAPLSASPGAGVLGVSGLYENLPATKGIERSGAVSYARRGLWRGENSWLDVGLTAEALSAETAPSVASVSRPDADAGALLRFADKYALGLSVVNANRPEFDFRNVKDRAPLTGRIGLSESTPGFLLSVEADKREPSLLYPSSQNLSAGMERWIATRVLGSVALRTGLSLGDRDKTWSVGLGWKVLGGRLDYSLTLPLSGAAQAGNGVSLAFLFGRSDPEKEFERVLDQEMEYRKDLAGALSREEEKEAQLARDLDRLRGEIATLKARLSDKEISARAAAKEASDKIRELEENEKEAGERLADLRRRMRKNSESAEKLKGQDAQARFQKDWSSYQKLKTDGVPDSLLAEKLRAMLRQYQGGGVDLSEANRELLRLLTRQ